MAKTCYQIDLCTENNVFDPINRLREFAHMRLEEPISKDDVVNACGGVALGVASVIHRYGANGAYERPVAIGVARRRMDATVQAFHFNSLASGRESIFVSVATEARRFRTLQCVFPSDMDLLEIDFGMSEPAKKVAEATFAVTNLPVRSPINMAAHHPFRDIGGETDLHTPYNYLRIGRNCVSLLLSAVDREPDR